MAEDSCHYNSAIYNLGQERSAAYNRTNVAPKDRRAISCMYSETRAIYFLIIMVIADLGDPHVVPGDGLNHPKESHHPEENDLVLGAQDIKRKIEVLHTYDIEAMRFHVEDMKNDVFIYNSL